MKAEDLIVNKVYETKFGEFCFSLKTKKGELTLKDKEALRAAWEQGTLLSINMELYQPDPNHKQIIERPKTEMTLYQQFKNICLRYKGEPYYQRLKEHLQVEHLRDLEKIHSVSIIQDVLLLQKNYIYDQMNGLPTVPDITGLSHKDNAYNMWKELFEEFNLLTK